MKVKNIGGGQNIRIPKGIYHILITYFGIENRIRCFQKKCCCNKEEIKSSIHEDIVNSSLNNITIILENGNLILTRNCANLKYRCMRRRNEIIKT